MNWEIVGVVALVVALIAGPFATLRAVSEYRIRMSAAAKKRQAEMAAKEKTEEASGDKPKGFW
ncbi:MAG TPA: hypothetical protein VLI06_09455 [Solimonas sp.]|nr:hypothetical protein [Solimonas sp.]